MTTQAPVLSTRSLVRQAYCLTTGLVLATTTYAFAQSFPQTDVFKQNTLAIQGALKVIALLAEGGGLGAYVFAMCWVIKSHCEHSDREFGYGARHFVFQVGVALTLPITLFIITMFCSIAANNFF